MKQLVSLNKGWPVSSILWILVFLTLAFIGCDGSSGGGGGGGTTPPTAVNHAPEITSTPVITATVGELYGYTVEATDLDGDSLEFGFVDVYPPAMTLDTKSGLINWLPDVADVGDNTIKVSVSDGTTADYQEYVLTVSLPPNHAPVFTSTPGTTVVAGQLHTYDANATDADADPLIFGLVTSPAGMSIVANTGISSWTPNLGQVGDHIITVSVTDGETTVFQQYTLTVSAPPNNAPVITSTPGTSVVATNLYQYNVTATDADADLLNFGLETSPAGMTIGSLTGIISFTPTVSQVGNHTIKVSVNDGEITVFQQYILTVSAPPNNAPVITSTAVIKATVGVVYYADVNATDADGDVLTYLLDFFPTGMIIDPVSGLITWTPTVGQSGDQLVTVTVSDGELSVSQSFTIAVNTKPVFTSSPVITVFVEQLYTYDADATDADGDTLTYSLNYSWPAGMSIDSSTGVVSWTPAYEDEGSHSIRVMVSDGVDYAIQWYILDVRFTNYPPNIYSSPVLTATSGQIYNYKVNASDRDGDVRIYFLDIAPVGMIINDLTGQISWLPRYDQKGDQQVKVGVSDGKVTTYQDYTVTVSWPVGTEMVFTSVPISTAFADIAYAYQAQAVAVSGQPLTFGLGYGPPGLSIDSSSGLVTWTPVSGDVGNQWVELTVTDGTTSVSQFYSLRVSPSNNGIEFQENCTLTSYWWNDLQSLTVENTILLMRDDGCKNIYILITWYQASISSTTIYPISTKTPSDAGIIHATNFAHSLGMEVYLKPHVDPGSTWRGYITFTSEDDWTAWFASYDAFISYYLDLAESLGVEGFVIGTEYKGTEHRATQWRNSIALGRSKFSGWITYCANWDSYATITWWDDLDFIGISAYFRLTTSYTPTVPDLVAAWIPIKTDLANLAAIWNMDIVFVEIGYQSRNGTNTKPDWVATATDLEEQSDCYEAAFLALFHEPWFKGMSWWMFYWNPAQDVNGFDVYNKPAELDLRWWYAGY